MPSSIISGYTTRLAVVVVAIATILNLLAQRVSAR